MRLLSKPAALFLFIAVLQCNPPVDQEIQVQYQKNAMLLCTAISDCLKNEIAQRLKHEPERRDLILSRMDRDLCVENQFKLIGQRSTQIHTRPAVNDANLYETYEQCALAVSKAEGCENRKSVYRTNQNCLLIRSEDFTN